MNALAFSKAMPDAKRWLGIRLGQNGPPMAARKRQLEPGVPANSRRRALIATLD
jgi:hypothetical protein